MKSFWQDVCYAARMYFRDKAFTLTALLTMALVLGANTGLFTVINAVLFRPLPYPEPDKIAQVFLTSTKGTSPYIGYAWSRFAEQNNHAFEYLAVWTPGPALSVAANNSTEMADTAIVSADFFRVFGVEPAVGRGFGREDDQPGAPAVAVISDSLWKRLFGGDRQAIGRAVRITGESYTVIGVMPLGFDAGTDADVWMPFRKAEDWTQSSVAYYVTGRMKLGISLEAARHDLDSVWSKVRAEHPEYYAHLELKSAVTTYLDWLVGDYRTPMLLVSVAGACILVIACVNIANLLLSRSFSRRNEIAVRIALGITPGRLVRQLLTENLLLAALSSVVGLALAYGQLYVLKDWLSDHLNRGRFVSIDARVLGFVVAATVLTGVAFGLAPALQLAHVNPASALRDFGRIGGSRVVRLFRAALITTQIALSTAILLAAGLLLTSLEKLRGHDLGFKTHGVLTVQIAMTDPKFRTTARVSETIERLMEGLNVIPGVRSAALVNRLPTDFPGRFDITLVPDPSGNRDQMITAIPREITPRYFEALHIALRMGRVFKESDGAGTQKVAIVNETFVRKYLGSVNALGLHVVVGRRMGPDFADDVREIVGIVGDTRGDRNVQQDAQPTIYTPTAQIPDRLMALLNGRESMALVVLTSAEQGAVGHEVREVVLKADSALAATEPRTLDEIVGEKTSTQKAQTILVTSFAAIALILAAVGLYGTISQAVAERRTEFGVRSALGATSGNLLRLMMGYGLKLTLGGLVLGVVLAVVLQRFIASYLYGVSATDPAVYATVLAVLAVTTICAILGPALRATRVDPRILLD